MTRVTANEAMEVPEVVLQGIPEDASPEEKLYLRAQMVIQSAFYTFGDRENLADAATIDPDELAEVLTIAIAMLMAADPKLKTSSDIEYQADVVGTCVRGTALAMRAMGDNSADLILKAIGLQSSPAH